MEKNSGTQKTMSNKAASLLTGAISGSSAFATILAVTSLPNAGMGTAFASTVLSAVVLCGSSAFIACRKQLFGRTFKKINDDMKVCGIVAGAAMVLSTNYAVTNGLKELQKTDKQKPQTDMRRDFNTSAVEEDVAIALKKTASPFKCTM